MDFKVRAQTTDGGGVSACELREPGVDPARWGAYTGPMSLHIVFVSVHVKSGLEDAFRKASLANASKSILEPGVVRFDVVQQTEDPARFVLVEVYRTPEDVARHKETAHYLTWRDTVAEMMAEPRRGVVHTNCFPADEAW